MKGLAALAVVGVLIYTLVHGCGSGSGSSGGMDEMARDFMAYDACKDAVSQQLKAPSTADFQGRTSVNYADNGGTSITLSGYVDAENSFGAKLRNEWVCTADVSSDGHVSNVAASVG